MIPVVVRTIANIASVTINGMAIRMTFPGRYRQPIPFGSFILFTLMLSVVFFGTGAVNLPYGGVLGSYGGAYGLLYLPLIVCLFKGLFFQKVFVVVSQLLIVVAQSYLVIAVIEIFIPYGSDKYFLVLLAAISIIYTAYIILMLKFGWDFMKKLFAFGREPEWALYTVGAMLSYAVLMFIHDASIGKILYIFILLFILWGFAVMCFAIINTHEKTRQRYESEFARDIISSGHDHYEKMNEMYSKLHFMRHDYKYHLNTLSELLSSGNKSEVDEYLSDIQRQLSENEIPAYCPNSVINALLASYSERCGKLNIKYSVEISMPETITVPNYEICIILGNLLENAVEAASHPQGGVHKIELVINTQGAHLAVMVKNSFDGKVIQDEDRLVSQKKDGGLGLRSVQAVAARYGGEFMTEWDDKTFMAYVLLRL